MSVGEEMGKLAWEGVGMGCKSDPPVKGRGKKESEGASQTAVQSQGEPGRPLGSYGTGQWSEVSPGS